MPPVFVYVLRLVVDNSSERSCPPRVQDASDHNTVSSPLCPRSPPKWPTRASNALRACVSSTMWSCVRVLQLVLWMQTVSKPHSVRTPYSPLFCGPMGVVLQARFWYQRRSSAVAWHRLGQRCALIPSRHEGQRSVYLRQCVLDAFCVRLRSRYGLRQDFSIHTVRI